MYKEFLLVPQEPELTARVLTYEIGDIHKCMIYLERFGKTGYHGELSRALADSHLMLGLLTEQLGFNIEELVSVGLINFKERQEQLLVEQLKNKVVKRNDD